MILDRSSLERILKPKLLSRTSIPVCDAEFSTPAAVLVPFVWTNDLWHLLYTKRTEGVATHQGEVSFPGGSTDPGDQSPIDTASRETLEEIGISKQEINFLGTLEPYPTISKFCVLPVVGIVNWPVQYTINPDEVEKILLFPIEWLRDQANWTEIEYTHSSGISRQVIRYNPYNGEILWGMTAGITRIVLDLLQ